MKLSILSRISLKDILAGAALSFTVAGGAFMLTLSGCSPSTTSPTSNTSTNVTFTQVYNDIFSVSCAQCHAPGLQGWNTGARLDFTSQQTAAATIFNHVSGSGSSTCPSFRYVVANNPGASYLVAVLDPNYNTPSGGCTPINSHIQSNGQVSSSEMSEILNWINSGASTSN